MRTRVIFRADGGTDVGMGHVVRSLALAEMLKSEFSIVFAIQDPQQSILEKIGEITNDVILLKKTSDFDQDVSEFASHLRLNDIVVLDGYNFKTDYQIKIKSVVSKLVVIDDLHDWHQVADVVINYADEIEQSDYSAEPYTRFYLGLDFVLLRKPFFRNFATERKRNKVRKVLISMGASDIHDLTGKYSEVLSQVEGIEEIHLLLGSVNTKADTFIDQSNKNGKLRILKHVDITAEELVSLIQQCDLVICPASTISLECCAVGIPLISGYTSDNQLGILDGLIKHKVAIDLDDLINADTEKLKAKILELNNNSEMMNQFVDRQKTLIDGRSPERLLNVFKKLSQLELSFRFANESDVDVYFAWANDPLVRKNSFNQNPVDHESHIKWFYSKLHSPDCYFYLFQEWKNNVGQVRIDKSGDEIIIGISIDESFRGRSAGAEMLKLACNDYLAKNSGAVIVAYIKKENSSSYSIFKKAGFGNDEIIMRDGLECYRLSLKSNQS